MTILVQPDDPVAVPVEEALTREAWKFYRRSVWNYRMDSHLARRYWARVGWFLGSIHMVLQLIVTIGSAGAVVTILAKSNPSLTIGVSVAVALCSAILQLANLSSRVQTAADLTEAWKLRQIFWDDAWGIVQDGKWLGPLSGLRKTESGLTRAETKVGFADMLRWKRSLMTTVESADSVQPAPTP